MEKNETWQRIYALAAEIYQLEPWKFLLESDVFGVMPPESKKEYFVSIMGSDGVLPAVAAYEGPAALALFWMLESSENAEGSDILSIPHLILSFETRDDIDPGQFNRFTSLSREKVSIDRFPEVRRVIPGQFPSEPDDWHLNEMVTILEQTQGVCQRAVTDTAFIQPLGTDESVYLIREPDNKNEKTEWTDTYRDVRLDAPQYKFTWQKKDIDEITALPTSQSVMQVHSQLLPLPVKQEGKPVFFPFLLLMLNKKSQRIEGYQLLIADPDYESMIEKVPEVFLGYIKALGFRPRTLEVKNSLLYNILHEPMQQCGIRLIQFKQLPAVNKAVESLIENMQKSR